MNQLNINLVKVLSVCLLLSLAAQCCGAATTVSIADITADHGGAVTVPLMISGMNDFGTGTINVTYDPSVIHVTDVTGSSDSVIAAFNNNNVAGFTAISASNGVGANGDIVFANVEFTAVGAGSTQLNIDVIALYNLSLNAISAAVDNGLFTSGGGDVSTSSVYSTASSGESDTGAASIRGGANPALASKSTSHNDRRADEDSGASISSPTVEPTPKTSESTPHSEVASGEAADTSGAASSAAGTTPNPEKTPGFDAISVVIGLVILSLIMGRDDT